MPEKKTKPSRVTAPILRKLKLEGRKITALTAYDYTFARLIDNAGVDVILVGDSLAGTVFGADKTVGVTMDEMIHHTRAVRAGITRALLVADMPFMSYHVSADEAVRNAGRLVREGGADMVKLEGAAKTTLESIRRIAEAGIPVMGHVGLTPQSVLAMGGHKIQGRDKQSARKVLNAAIETERFGAEAIVLEGIPSQLAKTVTASIGIPTIGIGAGPDCDGQVLVSYDMLGLTGQALTFVKQFARLGAKVSSAVKKYVAEVAAGQFPAREHCFDYKPGEEPEKMFMTGLPAARGPKLPANRKPAARNKNTKTRLRVLPGKRSSA